MAVFTPDTYIQAAYVTYFERPADKEGLQYWKKVIFNDSPIEDGLEGDAKIKLAKLCEEFSKTPEYKKTILANTDIRQTINGFYKKCFSRDGEVKGVDFWENAIKNGQTNLQTVGLEIIKSALETSVENSDQIILNAKCEAANKFTLNLKDGTYNNQESIDIAKNYIKNIFGVSSLPTELTLDDLISKITSASVKSGDVDPGDKAPSGTKPLSSSYSLSVLTDIVTGSFAQRLDTDGNVKETYNFAFDEKDQSVTGTFADVQASDKIKDINVADNDQVEIAGITGSLPQATIDKVEGIKLALKDFATGELAGGKGLAITNGKEIVLEGTVTKDNTAKFDATGSGITYITSTLTAAAGTAKTTITADAGSSKIITGATLDTIIGKAGDDEIDGGAGADDIKGGGGTNTISGGKGVDKFQLDAGVNTINDFALDKDVDTIIISDGAKATVNVVDDYAATVAADIDNKETTIADVKFVLADDKDFDASKATGTTAGLTITAAGNTAASIIIGTDKADNITGSKGDDEITGGKGDDVLTGGDGKQDFNFIAFADNGADTINSFSSTNDQLDVKALQTITRGADATTTIYEAKSGAKIKTASAEFATGKDNKNSNGVIGFSESAAADWSDVATNIAGALTVDGTAGNNAKLVFIIDNGTDTRVYNYADTTNGFAAADDLTLVATVAGIKWDGFAAADFITA